MFLIKFPKKFGLWIYKLARKMPKMFFYIYFFLFSDKLQAGDLTATEVLCTYVHFALLAHDRLNCVAEFLPEAFEAARKLDAEYAGGDKKKPPLFGLPFSVKANFYVGSTIFVKIII